MYMMRLEQLEMIRVQKAIAREGGKLFHPSSSSSSSAPKRPTTAPAHRPSRYLGEHCPSLDGPALPQPTLSTRPGTAHGVRAGGVTLGVDAGSATEEADASAGRKTTSSLSHARQKRNKVGPARVFSVEATQPPEPEPAPEPKPAAPERKCAWD